MKSKFAFNKTRHASRKISAPGRVFDFKEGKASSDLKENPYEL